jgi:hypothetical protein
VTPGRTVPDVLHDPRDLLAVACCLEAPDDHNTTPMTTLRQKATLFVRSISFLLQHAVAERIKAGPDLR